MVLSARDVTKRYRTASGSVDALAGVSLAVGAGECVALVGESGSGKTTLLRCFNRLVDPDEGVIVVDGTDVRHADAIALRRRIGYVLQEGGLLPHWTVRRNVELVPRLLGAPNAGALASDALALVGFGDGFLDARYPRQLSGGQRQRVAMARALAARPAVLLLDEPFGALDAIIRAELQGMFLAIRRERPVTCVLVTHDLAEAARLADTIAVMRAGRIEQIAPSRELIDHPGTDYVARLVQMSGVRHRLVS
ncbi:MAG TPA: ATP-binding cassette domain-containing protein [Gemmatimonadaceae bacterium]|nr:ATP-binding cassette domain-containing protein [Gemmatimonadaceae bacterium]